VTGIFHRKTGRFDRPISHYATLYRYLTDSLKIQKSLDLVGLGGPFGKPYVGLQPLQA
jgi:hypothetical protein